MKTSCGGFNMKKYFILITLAIILTIVTSFAGNIYDQISIYYNDTKIIAGQKEIDLPEQLFIYEGHTYVPLRHFAEALDYVVDWHRESETITLSKNLLEDCNPLVGEYFVYGQITKIEYSEHLISIEQHIDDNSREIFDKLKVVNNPVVIIDRNSKEFNIEFSDVKVGDLVGLIVNKNDEVRGIIVFI